MFATRLGWPVDGRWIEDVAQARLGAGVEVNWDCCTIRCQVDPRPSDNLFRTPIVLKDTGTDNYGRGHPQLVPYRHADGAPAWWQDAEIWPL